MNDEPMSILYIKIERKIYKMVMVWYNCFRFEE